MQYTFIRPAVHNFERINTNSSLSAISTDKGKKNQQKYRNKHQIQNQ